MRNAWHGPVVGLLAAAIVGLAACPPATGGAQIVGAAGGLYECPHTWTWKDKRGNGDLALPGRITNIPEFHDCQQFIQDQKYIGLFAIFAAESLMSRWDSVAQDSDSVSHPLPLPRAWAIGEVYSHSDPYPNLGIKPGFNCLYFFYRPGRPGGARLLQARMTPVGSDEAKCVDVLDPATLPGTDLEVQRHLMPGYGSPDDYSVLARWDWDRAKQRQFIGISCGVAWCEVGTPSGAASMAKTDNVVFGKVVDVKGWHDDQSLAVAQTGGGLIPSPVRGAAIPDPALGSYNTIAQFGHWASVAEIQLTQPYQGLAAKWHIPMTEMGTVLRVSMCAGLCPGLPDTTTKAGYCIQPSGEPSWWARIQYGSGGVVYRCIARRDHSAELAGTGLHIPAAARWHWVAHDETLWTRCLEGCCEVR